jgi:hypothetical protein
VTIEHKSRQTSGDDRLASISAPHAFGFLARNEFQFCHLEHVIRRMNAPVICRPKLAQKLRAKYHDVVFIEWRKTWFRLYGDFAVIVVQGGFDHAETLKHSKLAMMQYGYAKAPYNFGDMRALADLNLAYGTYAEERFSAFAPAVSVGHPGIEAALEPDEISKTERYLKDIFPEPRPIVLYAPTWGDLSSLSNWIADIASLGESVNVLIKLHHNSVAEFKSVVSGYLNNGSVALVEDGPSLLSLSLASDVVASDQSGAVFDAMLAGTPVVILQGDPTVVQNHKKQDQHSLEINRASELGVCVHTRQELSDAITNATKNPLSNSPLVDQLYCPAEGSVDRIVAALISLRDGEVVPSQMQSYVMSSVRKSRSRISKQRRFLLWGVMLAVVLLALVVFI